MAMKTITLPEELDFAAALQSLLAGKCLGIRPDGNAQFVVFCRPSFLKSDFLLGW